MECGTLVNGTFLDINGETSRLLSKNCGVCREGLRSDKEVFRRKRFKPLLVLTFWDILVVYSSLFFYDTNR